MNEPLTCHIYRSTRKADTYLYLAEKDDFSVLPEELLQVFGEPEFSFSLEISANRRLAKEDPEQVLHNLHDRGYHLQMADDLLVEQQLALKGLN